MLAFIVLLGGIAGPVLLMIGLVATPTSTASLLLLNLEGGLTLGIAWVVFRENVDVRIGAGVAAILGASRCCRGRRDMER